MAGERGETNHKNRKEKTREKKSGVLVCSLLTLREWNMRNAQATVRKHNTFACIVIHNARYVF